MSTATKNLLFRSLRNNFSNVQTYSKHLKVCQWLNTVGYPDWWAPPGIQTAYTCQLDMTCMRFLPCHDRNLRKHPGDFQRLSEDFKTLPKMSADVLKTFEHIRNCFTRQQQSFVLWFRQNTKKDTSFNTFLDWIFIGRGQNMDQGSMDPHFGPGPWTTFMDRVHGPPFMDRVHGHFFLINENWTKTEIEQK